LFTFFGDRTFSGPFSGRTPYFKAKLHKIKTFSC
jgi:hypothetical protein